MVIPVCNDAQLCHSVVCHDNRVEAARIASQLSFEKVPIALWRPLIAVPRWKYASCLVSWFRVIQARWAADRARIELMTNSLDKAIARKLFKKTKSEIL